MEILSKKHNSKLECLICPHRCKIEKDRCGICGVRKNTGQDIELMTYGVVTGYSVDPVEKKPLYHFYPGHSILSIGSYGCNMRCDFCQNYNISQQIPSHFKSSVSPMNVIESALEMKGNIGIAFTYNEPVIWYEYIRDIALPAREKGLNTVMVSNGYVNKEVLDEIILFTDAFNIDLKAFNNDFYRRLTGSELEPVKRTLKQIAESGRHLEITTLIITGENDSEKEMQQQARWIAENLGADTPLHLSRYFPTYKRNNPATSTGKLERLFMVASEYLDYVYLGNITSQKGQNTICPVCGSLLTTRTGYITSISNIDETGRCINCGKSIYRYLTSSSQPAH